MSKDMASAADAAPGLRPSGAEPATQSQAKPLVPDAGVYWTHLVRLRGGEIGRYFGKCPITGKHRVQTYKDERGRYMDPPEPGDRPQYQYTTWLLNDQGQCRGDLAPSDKDYAQAIEARRAETGTGSVHESAVPEGNAP